jgi:hypothetical protein
VSGSALGGACGASCLGEILSTKKRDFDPNKTIQLDVLGPNELFDQASLDELSRARARSTPPPLPSLSPLASPPASASSQRRPTRTAGIIAMFVVLLAAAVVGGLLVGARVRGGGQAAEAPAVAPSTPSDAPRPPASATQQTLTVPTVEMK